MIANTRAANMASKTSRECEKGKPIFFSHTHGTSLELTEHRVQRTTDQPKSICDSNTAL